MLSQSQDQLLKKHVQVVASAMPCKGRLNKQNRSLREPQKKLR